MTADRADEPRKPSPFVVRERTPQEIRAEKIELIAMLCLWAIVLGLMMWVGFTRA